jgi:cation:H+ antiporter
MLTYIALLIAGILLLYGGGELLIKGAVSVAKKAGVSELFTGLVIVGFGTSFPELMVSVGAAMQGASDIAAGNVIGSNISNTLLILGVCAAVLPLVVTELSLRRDATAVLIATVILMILSIDGMLGLFDAIFMLILMAVYLFVAYKTESVHFSKSEQEFTAITKPEESEVSYLKSLIWTLVGLVLLIAGARFMLNGALGISEVLNISEAVVGLTVVAVGTSLPELTISLLAVIRGNTDVAVGNILGSNIFNLLGILGISVLFQPISFNPRILEFDQWILLGTAILLFVFMMTGRKLTRGEGGLLLFGYVAYVLISYMFVG